MKQALLVEFPELRTDGRSAVTFRDARGVWHTLAVQGVRPRKREVLARDLVGRRWCVPFRDVLEVWERPYRAKKSRLVWRRP